MGISHSNAGLQWRGVGPAAQESQKDLISMQRKQITNKELIRLQTIYPPPYGASPLRKKSSEDLYLNFLDLSQLLVAYSPMNFFIHHDGCLVSGDRTGSPVLTQALDKSVQSLVEPFNRIDLMVFRMTESCANT